MKLYRKSLPLFFVLLFLFHGSLPAQSGNKSFFWQVTSDTTTVYILGSIHFAKPEMYPLAKSIENAFKESDNLVVELNPISIDKPMMLKILKQKGMYDGKRTIKDDLTDDVFQMLMSYLKNYGMPYENVQKMRAGLIAITLSTVQIMKMGFLPQFGIDMYFALKARQAGKQIIELETMEQQLNLLLNMPDDNLYLKYTLRDLENIDKLFNKIIYLWKNGDAAGMKELILQPYENDPELELIIEKLFVARNNKMTERIKSFLKTEQRYFVVVGAGHLLGNSGIVSQLKKSGYEIKQL